MHYRYRWLKDGRALDVDAAAGISQRPGKGTITIEIDELQSHHDGLYQCIASNDFGTAVSVKALLKRASKYSSYMSHPFCAIRHHHHHHHYCVALPLEDRCMHCHLSICLSVLACQRHCSTIRFLNFFVRNPKT